MYYLFNILETVYHLNNCVHIILYIVVRICQEKRDFFQTCGGTSEPLLSKGTQGVFVVCGGGGGGGGVLVALVVAVVDGGCRWWWWWL
jgi:hypothetical protein